MDEEITVIDWFAGIGGFRYGLELAGGFRTVAYSEIDPYACAVYEKHWPGTPNLGDVRTAVPVEADMWCAGFPCQDISHAGPRTGVSGPRSGLYGCLVRTIRLVRPRVILLENVAALLGRGMGQVLGDLAEVGYDTEWDCISACEVGAPHRRERVFIVAHSDREGLEGRWLNGERPRELPTWQGVPPSHWTEHARRVAAVDDGLPRRLAMHAAGNSVVPQVVAWIGEQIKTAWLRGGGEG